MKIRVLEYLIGNSPATSQQIFSDLGLDFNSTKGLMVRLGRKQRLVDRAKLPSTGLGRRTLTFSINSRGLARLEFLKGEEEKKEFKGD